ncbi:MAG: threonine synthase [Candidatus Heimdallarchaeaceae archaeon]
MQEKIKSSYLSKLQCTFCGEEYNPEVIHTVCKKCGKVLFAKYDIEGAKESVIKDSMSKRAFNIWRIKELMPVKEERFRFSLGEGWTPILKLFSISEELNLNSVFLKDEGLNPTGTFKSRGLCAAVSKATELGIRKFVIPTAGNAGAALSAYVARANGKVKVFMPMDAPELIQKEVLAYGAELELVEGIISDAGRKAKEFAQEEGYFDVSTLKEPYRVEGKKTMGFEIAEQFNWELPDVIVYPTGGGTGIIGMWKAFNELEELGFIGSERPRMVSVQTSGCAPIVRAFQEKKDSAEFWDDASTIAGGLRVPSAIGDYLILRTIKESEGSALTVDDSEIIQSMKLVASKEGIMLAPEAAATVAALKKLKEKEEIEKDEKIVVFATGGGLITPELWGKILKDYK